MFSGSIVAMVTPMTADLGIDWSGFERLINFHIENKTDVIAVVGTTGESATITPAEHIEAMEKAVKIAAGRIPIIAGTGANSTAEAIHLAKAAKDAGCDAHLSVVPYYNKPTQKGLIAHYKAIINAVDLPMILYNVPGRTSCDLAVSSVLELAKVDGIIGIKEASTLERTLELIEKCPKGFAVYSGDDPIACEVINKGGYGVISVTANIAPAQMAEMTKLAKTDLAKAQTIDEKLSSLHTDLFVQSSPAPTKWALSEMGLIENYLRLPLVTLEDEFKPVIKSALNKAQII